MDVINEANKKTRRIARLSGSAKVRQKNNCVVLDGVHVVKEAILRLGTSVFRELYVVDEVSGYGEVRDILDQCEGVNVHMVAGQVMREIAVTTTPQGILAVIDRPKENCLSKEHFVVLCENIQDPQNVGALIRIAAALGIEAAIFSKGCADPWGPRALRASQGAHFYTKIITNADAVSMARDFSGEVIATVLNSEAKSVFETDLTRQCMIALGNEGSGISSELAAVCNEEIYIPMPGQFESLNVASTFAIVCGEKMRVQNR